jgi:foldase protein PrsA
MNSSDQQNGAPGTTAPESEANNAPAALDGVNANADYWAEWEEKRAERRRQYLIEHGDVQPQGATPPPRGQRHFGLFKRPAGPTDAEPQPAPEQTDLADVPIDNASRVEEAAPEKEELAEFWVQWAAQAATTAPGAERHRPGDRIQKQPAPEPEPEPEPAPAQAAKPARVKAGGFDRRAAKRAREMKQQEEIEAANRAAEEKAAAEMAVTEAQDLQPAIEDTPTSDTGETRPKRVWGGYPKLLRANPVTVSTENGETVIKGGAAHQGYWTDWASKRRVEHSAEKKETRQTLVKARRKFVLLGIVIFGCGVALGSGAVAYHFRADRLAVAVNGHAISQSEYVRRLEIDGGQAALTRIITQEEMLQFAAKHGLMPTDGQIHSRIAEMRKKPDFTNYLTQSRQTFEDLNRTAAFQLATEALTTQGVQATDAEMQEFYKTNIDQSNPNAQFYTPKVATVRVIISMSMSDLGEAIHELHLGFSFDTVARHYSKDQSASNGGLLPPITEGRTRLASLKNIERAIFRLTPGARSAPVKFMKGWAIFHCESMTPATTRGYDEVKEDCRRGVLMRKGMVGNSARLTTEFQDFQKKSSIINLRQP